MSATSDRTAQTPTEDPERAQALVLPLYADRSLESGESLEAHARAMVQIVRGVRPDPDLLTAAYLFAAHEVVRDADRWLRNNFGPSVAQLVGDLRQLRHLSDTVRNRMRSGPQTDAAMPEGQEEYLRRMLLAMVNDMRVVLLRLASRLQTMRYLAAHHPSAAPAYARETRTLYAPLANRLGIWQFKWELEDLSLRFLEPQAYQHIARLLEEKREQREQRVAAAVDALQSLLQGAGIAAMVSGRPKHIASIAAKMHAKKIAFERVFDQSALRVVVDSVEHCYEVLALAHQRWHPIESEFDDYIAKPKANGYQSLHTVVEDDDGKPIEIQIRTSRMHEQAELGVAAHWRYKEGGGGKDRPETEKVAWLRRLLDWQREVEPVGGPQSGDRVYALTPQGRVVELPHGATPIDFAYHVHTELGHRCRGARVDGALVSLNTALRTGQTVEILSARTGGPSRDWLNPDLGFLASARSKAKVRQWFHAQEYEQSVAAGREVLLRELQRLGRTAVGLEELARRLGYASVEELCAAATKEEFSVRSVEHALLGTEPAAEEAPLPLERPRQPTAGRSAVLVVGVGSLLTSLARCCRPIPPDPIVGFITRGRGVSVHRANCANARMLMGRQPERLIEVQWETGPAAAEAAYPVELVVLANDRQGLLRDVSEVFAREKLNVVGVNTVSRRDQAQMNFTVEVPDGAALRRSLAQLAEIKGVLVARRK
ncbi:MAG TPA: bifunctional (p)ppGpp synthetase/guanosine-3',5'-bis(diphosphate) 3'-pyrophosphohydrolase [Burkholderiaceae bacterium]|nr:bifunctional (p)ppGpp synthetase/guanosine-3',5'-bis(diphosphate) 3'-pyrophosphohydrolase [Burkholderiaceae bacterium]